MRNALLADRRMLSAFAAPSDVVVERVREQCRSVPDIGVWSWHAFPLHIRQAMPLSLLEMEQKRMCTHPFFFVVTPGDDQWAKVFACSLNQNRYPLKIIKRIHCKHLLSKRETSRVRPHLADKTRQLNSSTPFTEQWHNLENDQ